MTTLPNNNATPQAVAGNATKIEVAVAKVLNAVINADGERSEAQKLAQAASENSGAQREKALIALAQAATAGNWSAADCIVGVTSAVEKRNSKDTSIATFASEIKRALNPHVRAHVGSLFALATQAWDAEANDKKADKLLRRTFSRRYHMVVGEKGLFGATVAGQVFKSTTDIHAFATTKDPLLDPANIAKRVKNLRQQLQDIYADFPLEGLKTVDAYLDAVTAEELTRARADAVQDAHDESDEPEVTEPENDSAEDVLDAALEGLTA